MTAVEGPAALAWTSVYLGLFGFYLLAGHRFPRRGYAHLAGLMLCFSVGFFLLWLLGQGLSGRTSLWLGRAIVVCGAIGPALHTDFVARFVGLMPKASRAVRASYLIAAAFIAVDATRSLTQRSPSVSDLGGARNLANPDPRLATLMAVAVFVHIFFAALAYVWALRQGRRRFWGLVLLVTLIGPAVGADYAYTFITGSGFYITEIALWIYGLAIALVLLLELRGAEGLLAETTSSLLQRTQELEFSYAELELVHSELTQKEQLAAVGELAQSIAHEVRNPLAVIVNAASGLRRPVTAQDQQTLLNIIDEEAARLNQLVGELLRFARPMRPATGPVHLEDLCEELREQAAPHQLTFRRSEPDRQLELWVDAGLLRLGLEYLVQNSQQALASPGRIDIILRPGNFNDGIDAVVVEVNDNGGGMAPDVLERALKPFFTTRPRGTGLGLSIVQRIVEAHGGEIELRSVVGRGTTVFLRFPRADSAKLGRITNSGRRLRRPRLEGRLDAEGPRTPDGLARESTNPKGD